MLKHAVKGIVRTIAPPLVKNKPITTWPGWLGRTLDVKVPASVIPKQEKSPTGQANINILLQMIDRTKHLAGDIADAGVFRGCSTIAMGLYLRESGVGKTIYGFDSFEGFPETADADLALGGVANEDRHTDGFSSTSLALVSAKIARFHLKNICLVQGFFEESFSRLESATNLSFCFVHLDVNLYDSYRTCLKFFYPRVVPGGIILMDEYNDPPWPGCRKAVDEFMRDKPETLEVAEVDNYQKWYFTKLPAVGRKMGAGAK